MTRDYYKRKTCKGRCGKRRKPSDFHEGQNICKFCRKKRRAERKEELRRLGLNPSFKKAQRPRFIPKKGQRFNAFQKYNNIIARCGPFVCTKVTSHYVNAKDLLRDLLDPKWQFIFSFWRFEPVEKA